jgi:hypothetical protein
VTNGEADRKIAVSSSADTFLNYELIWSHLMKKLLIVILTILSITPAYADRGWGWRGAWIAPAVVGGVIAYDLAYPYRYPYAYPYPVYTQPFPVYEQTYPVYVQPAPAQPPAQLWYYCASAKGYYPYVSNCPEGWKPIPAQPPHAE